MIKTLFIRSGTARISFGVEVVLEEPVNTTLKWGMVLQPNVTKNQLHLVSEEIVDLDTKETLVQYKASAGGRIKGDKEELSIMPNFVITSSCLKVIHHLHGVYVSGRNIAQYVSKEDNKKKHIVRSSSIE